MPARFGNYDDWRVELIGSVGRIQPQFDDVRDFFLYIEEYRKDNPDHLFNRVTIVATDSQIIDIAFIFDESLQKQTMENIK
jgi:hypothetical protein